MLKVLGGQAHKNGITFSGLNHSITAIRNADGHIDVTENDIKSVPSWAYSIGGVFLLRCISDVILPFYSNWLVGLVYIIVPVLILIQFNVALMTIGARSPLRVLTFILVTQFIIMIICQLGKVTQAGRSTAKYHGAEHMIHNLYYRTNGLNKASFRYSERVHYRCGGNFLILLFIYASLVNLTQMSTTWKIILWFPFYSEIERISNGILSVLLIPYRALIYIFQLSTTSKPTQNELEVGIAAIRHLLKKEGINSESF